MALRLPSPCVVVLIGPSGSGKSTWADATFGPGQVVSSDRLRGLVGDGEHDQRAGEDAFALLEDIVSRRLARRLTTVIDTLGLDADRRRAWVTLARAHKLPVFAVPFVTPAAVCRDRNRARDRSVPVKVLDGQLKRFADQVGDLESEGFDAVVDPEHDTATVPPSLARAAPHAARQREQPVGLSFGLQIPDFGVPGGAPALRDALAAIGRAADEVGFESLWVMDHLVQIPFVGAAWLDMLESYTTLAYLAGVTERVRLGALVTGITYRNPAHLAKIIATLDVVSGGRAECGLGAAWFEQEHRAYGYLFPPLAERYELLEDALRLLPAMWSKGAKPFEGHRISLPETTCYPRPLQDRIPVMVGGGGEKRTLRLVAEYADATNLIGDAAVVARKRAVLERHCEEIGRDPSEIRITQLSTTLVGEDRMSLRAAVDRLRGNTPADTYAARVSAGTVDDQIGRFRELADVGVSLAIVSLPDVSPTAIETFAPIIEAFT